VAFEWMTDTPYGLIAEISLPRSVGKGKGRKADLSVTKIPVESILGDLAENLLRCPNAC